jgi:hypothetical protein
MTRSSGPRKAADLSEPIHRQLNMYALAATAAGVGTLALPQPSEARIVYTAAHVKIQPQQKYCFDIDRDQRLEVCLTRRGHYYNTYVLAFVEGSQQGNGIAASRPGRAWELAILPGAKIGPARHFTNSSYDLMADGNSSKGASHVTWGGPWANGGRGVKNRYLGIKFKGGDGYSHYGWVRATVTIDNPKINQISSVLLTGYAYETIPNKPIVAGATKGTDNIPEGPDAALTIPSPEPATLGVLALGAPGLSIWRREESAETTQ